MPQFTCTECGYGSSSWYGKCPSCDAWNSLIKAADEKKGKQKVEDARIIPFAKITKRDTTRKSTGVFEFDRVLGGGFVPGEVVLISGEPGVGKSTLILKSLSKLWTIYISGEESAHQVSQRADRLKMAVSKFHFSDTVQVESIIKSVGPIASRFDVLVIDSIQTAYTKDIPSPPGGMAQIREVISRLVDFAKEKSLILVLVGHITKGGEIAGPKTLEHLVDCVLYLEGERVSQFRVLRAYKNRYGTTDEVGVFEMRDVGLVEVTKPTAFLEDTSEAAPGKAIVGVAEGSRSLFFEVQSLVVPTALPVPRRVVAGVDYNKVQLLLAVIRKNLKLPLDKFDIYVNVVGGVSIKSTAADLGIVASVVSSVKNIPLPKKSVFIGEIGLLGEVRIVYSEAKIMKEARRYGFSKIYSAKSIKSVGNMTALFRA